MAARHVRPIIEHRWPRWRNPVSLLAPWLHGPALAFAALFSGALPGQALGLLGSGGWIGWLWGALMVVLLWFAARRALQRWPIALDLERYDVVVLDEPRWALYRGGGWLLTGSFFFGALAGLGLALLEWLLRWRGWRRQTRSSAPACFALARVGSSALVFSLTGNLWLTALLQVGLAVLLAEDSA